MRQSTAAVLLCAFALVALAHGCSFGNDPQSVIYAKQFVTPNNIQLNGYTDVKVKQFLDNQGILETGDVRGTTFSCVDARGEEPILGTAGGDLAEWTVAMRVVEKELGQEFSFATIEKYLHEFIDSRFITPNRPLYFHSSDQDGPPGGLQYTFRVVAERSDPKIHPIVFPERIEPGDKNLKVWLDALVEPLSNGCGHLHLMLDRQKNNTVVYTSDQAENKLVCSQDSDGTAFAYGARAKEVAEHSIRAFFTSYITTQLGSMRRKKTLFKVLQGRLVGQSVGIISSPPSGGKGGRRLMQQDVAATPAANLTQSAAGAEVAIAEAVMPAGAQALRSSAYNLKARGRDTCALTFPLIQPSLNGGTIFVYHPEAVGLFRRRVLARWLLANIPGLKSALQCNKDCEEVLGAKLDARADADLTATLTYLPPANCITITQATYPRKS